MKGTAGQRAGQCCSRLGAQCKVGKLSVFQSAMIGRGDGQALKDEAQAGLRVLGFWMSSHWVPSGAMY